LKLAYLALALGLVSGACVAEDSAAGRTDNQVTDFNVADEAEIPKDEGVTPDFAIVVLTGIEIPGRVPMTEHIDITNVDTATLRPEVRDVCAQADSLPSSDVCSTICTGFSAKLFDQGAPGGCTQHTCVMPGGTTVNLDACVGD
jgi:hypothetical protein